MRKLTDENRLSLKFPELVLEWSSKNKLLPQSLSYSSHRMAYWICKVCEFEWQCKIQDRTRTKKPSGCPICGKKRQNSSKCFYLDPRFSHLVQEWDWERNKKHISEYFISSKEITHWICSKNPEHRWETSLDLRTLGKSGCHFCCSRKINHTNSFRNLANEKLIMEWNLEKNEVSPEEISYKNSKSVWWVCSKNSKHEWKAKINNRVSNDTGCPYCYEISSKGEKEVRGFAEQIFQGEIKFNDRTLLTNPKTGFQLELDIYIPGKNLAIEYNGDYYHSKQEVIEKDRIKQQLCEEKGIKLITIWESDWKKEPDKIIKSLQSI